MIDYEYSNQICQGHLDSFLFQVKMYLLSLKGLDSHIVDISSERNRVDSVVMCIATFNSYSGESIRARWDIGETEGARGISHRGRNRPVAIGDGYRGSSQYQWCSAVQHLACQYGAVEAEALHREGNCHRLHAFYRCPRIISRRDCDCTGIDAWEQVRCGDMYPERTS